MKAFVYLQDDKGNDKLGSGVISQNYKNLINLRKYFLNKLIVKGIYNVYVYYNWDNRYGKEDLKFTFKKD